MKRCARSEPVMLKTSNFFYCKHEKGAEEKVNIIIAQYEELQVFSITVLDQIWEIDYSNACYRIFDPGWSTFFQTTFGT